MKIKFTNSKNKEQNFDQNFSFFADFDQTKSFASVERELIETISDAIILDIFNKTVTELVIKIMLTTTDFRAFLSNEIAISDLGVENLEAAISKFPYSANLHILRALSLYESKNSESNT